MTHNRDEVKADYMDATIAALGGKWGQLHTGHIVRSMADEIVRLREQLATAAPVVPVVTEAQIEAVAKVLRQRDEGTAWCTWDTIKPQTRALYMDEARKILTAASEGQNDA